MNTITVSVPKKLAQKYGNQIVDYSELVSFVAENIWIDSKVQPQVEMKDFYALVKNSGNG